MPRGETIRCLPNGLRPQFLLFREFGVFLNVCFVIVLRFFYFLCFCGFFAAVVRGREPVDVALPDACHTRALVFLLCTKGCKRARGGRGGRVLAEDLPQVWGVCRGQSCRGFLSGFRVGCQTHRLSHRDELQLLTILFYPRFELLRDLPADGAVGKPRRSDLRTIVTGFVFAPSGSSRSRSPEIIHHPRTDVLFPPVTRDLTA